MPLKLFLMRINNIELRVCDNHLINQEPLSTVEIVQWGTTSCWTIAYWTRGKEGYNLRFCGNRPFNKGIDISDFMELAKRGQEILDKYYMEDEEPK